MEEAAQSPEPPATAPPPQAEDQAEDQAPVQETCGFNVACRPPTHRPICPLSQECRDRAARHADATRGENPSRSTNRSRQSAGSQQNPALAPVPANAAAPAQNHPIPICPSCGQPQHLPQCLLLQEMFARWMTDQWAHAQQHQQPFVPNRYENPSRSTYRSAAPQNPPPPPPAARPLPPQDPSPPPVVPPLPGRRHRRRHREDYVTDVPVLPEGTYPVDPADIPTPPPSRSPSPPVRAPPRLASTTTLPYTRISSRRCSGCTLRRRAAFGGRTTVLAPPGSTHPLVGVTPLTNGSEVRNVPLPYYATPLGLNPVGMLPTPYTGWSAFSGGTPQANNAGGPMLCPWLGLNPGNPNLPQLVWDLRLPPSQARRIAPRSVTVPARTIFNESIMRPSTRAVRIAYNSATLAQVAFWDRIAIDKGAGAGRVSIGDALDAIYAFFQQPLTPNEAWHIEHDLPPEVWADVKAAFTRRCREHPGLPEYEWRQGVRRVDCLGERVMFGAMWITHSADEPGAYMLNLGTVPRQTQYFVPVRARHA
ncbi:hypothetical protein C8Q80DRAFT_1137202 [Daedaleopsis nitida]|nr:hypothetical protein C8Q80DRAFT_1137202 [Daedaleopsis nitida]